MIYSTSLDKFAKTTSLLVTILFLIIAGFPLFITRQLPSLVPAICLVLIYALVLLYKPLRYEITPQEVYVHRLISRVGIPIDQIQAVQEITKPELGALIRTFGVGGLFGYFGSFDSSKLGSLSFYATRRDQMVLLKTTDQSYIITPDEPSKFVAVLTRQLQQREQLL